MTTPVSRVDQRPRLFDLFKRTFDVVAAGAALIVLAPAIGAVALLVRLRLGAPVLFRQDRPGLDGKVFGLLKFRTMHATDVAKGRVSNEERMTRLGSWLRSWSLDELPSLWNIVRGDMSIVGPRPLLVKYLPLYTPEQARRHAVRPGLTGLAQISGRNSLAWEERFALDVHYVDNRSAALDLRIMATTVRKVVRREGITSTDSVVGAPFTTGRTSSDG